ncbi:unnamed protein product, partial [Sphacelaria rigidula]
APGRSGSGRAPPRARSAAPLREGAALLRAHCRKWPAKMLEPEVCAMMESLVDDDLGRWSSSLFTSAVVFQRQHPTPPNIEDMPPVVTPQWTFLRNFIDSGGLRGIRIRTSSLLSPTKRSRSGNNQIRDRHRFVEAKEGVCCRRNCPWEHNKKANRRSSNGGDGPRASGGGGGGGGNGRVDGIGRAGGGGLETGGTNNRR